MSEARRPYDHTLHAINELNEQVSAITTWPTGQPRPLDGRMSATVLQVRGQLAIASALLAVADAIRERQNEGTT
ncbi:hypothetical protein ACFSL4_01585 [Streptomyces caeni]|uniref:Uncharacterized protein n=1 Tax=Streptomyces caeni TaxID=2307231 RepID=A0ABW4IJ88_9ACTN